MDRLPRSIFGGRLSFDVMDGLLMKAQLRANSDMLEYISETFYLIQQYQTKGDRHRYHNRGRLYMSRPDEDQDPGEDIRHRTHSGAERTGSRRFTEVLRSLTMIDIPLFFNTSAVSVPPETSRERHRDGRGLRARRTTARL